jgi:hypothetical protein
LNFPLGKALLWLWIASDNPEDISTTVAANTLL